MNFRITLSILLGLIPAILLACSCLPTSISFSLMQYDQAELIVEVVAGEQFDREQPNSTFGLQKYQEALQEAKAAGRIPPPPPPPPLSHTYKQKATVETIFKGSLDTDEIILISDGSSSTCGWLPTSGSRYILYLNSSKNESEATVYWVGLCSRKFNASSRNFMDEKRILKLLSHPAEGEFSEQQTIELNDRVIDFYPFKGNFKAGKRDGKWLIYPPVYSWRDTQDFNQPALVLNYQDGQLINMEDLKDVADDIWFNWIRHWRSCYFGRESID